MFAIGKLLLICGAVFDCQYVIVAVKAPWLTPMALSKGNNDGAVTAGLAVFTVQFVGVVQLVGGTYALPAASTKALLSIVTWYV